jgi:phosphoribosylamine--glycine ligase
MRKILYQGSVKDIYEKQNRLEFEFSDRYSIFDWGEMPDKVDEKGKHLTTITTALFDYLNEPASFKNISYPKSLSKTETENLKNSKTLKDLVRNGARTHFIKEETPTSFLAKKMTVLKPNKINNEYDYTRMNASLTNILIPLEVVFRLGVPQGSSYLKRYPNKVQADQFLDNIEIDFYTKLEPQDRLLTPDSAQEISALTDHEFNDLIEYTKLLAVTLHHKFKEIGFTLWDGKFEFGLNENREIVLIDSIGPDEIRLSRKGVPYSKQVLRDFYKKTAWYKQLIIAQKKSEHFFKDYTYTKPTPLESQQLDIASYIYRCIAMSLSANIPYSEDTYEDKLRCLYQRIVIFGKGGREHALANHLISLPDVHNVIVVPGNPGMLSNGIKTINLDRADYSKFCIEENINLTIIGPENLLEDGLSDELEALGVPTFAPSRSAARLETSKSFSKNLMKKYDIPTAGFKTFKHIHHALEFLNLINWKKYVVKQSSLAAGKGVIICETKDQARQATKELFEVDSEIIIEEFLEGREVSYFAICLGNKYSILGDACDYKTLKNGNKGPNTGGMGCYSPVTWLTASEKRVIDATIIKPTLDAMIKEEKPFKGVLFVGLMMTDSGPKVLEYNVRFGDPETQTIAPLINSGFLESITAIARKDEKEFSSIQIKNSGLASVHIVKAAKGYPGVKGETIRQGDLISSEYTPAKNSHLFFAGVSGTKQELKTAGGRVLGLTIVAEDVKQARTIGYQEIQKIRFTGEQFREDIGL